MAIALVIISAFITGKLARCYSEEKNREKGELLEDK